MKLKVKRIKKEKTKTRKKGRILNWILIFITSLAILIFLGAIGFVYYIVNSAPEFNPNLLYEKEATLIYDSSNTLIATLGIEKREKITYDELPEVLIDAIVATEDSRFFQHNGFDLARFLKASVGQVLGNSSAGGGSTLTMQVSKNTFTSKESSGVAGIIRKFTDIYMSIFKIEKYYSKEEILEFYVNSPFLGSNSYGVEQASQTYFGKSVGNLSLPEAALIAGLFQAPSAYDPYSNPKDAEARRNQVLNLMVRHGYITEDESEAAKAISVESLLVGKSSNISKYQGFIDTVVEEVRLKTGNDPYQIPMEIFTTMVKSKQDVINNFYDTYTFKDKKVQVGAAVIDNDTGAILAVGAGRNKTTELSFNYATMTNRHPGSTAKPLFDYGPGFEYQKWSTYTPCFDEKGTKYSSGGVINNWNSSYDGMVSLKYALVKSKNTCALQAFQKLDNAQIYKFVTSLGITPETTNGYIGEAHAVGGFTGVSPVVLAGAFAGFGSGGYYTEPYSVTKVVYRDTTENTDTPEVYEPSIKRERVMSAQTAYLITTILYGVTPSTVRVSGTRVATKTGTSSYDSKLLKSVGLTSSTIRDSWMVSYTSDYTIAFWYGYDELTQEYKNNKWYVSMGTSSTERRNIMGKLANDIFEKNSSYANPGGISSRKVELGTIPAQSPSDYTPSSLIETHLFISGTEPSETSTRFSKLTAPTNLSLVENGAEVIASWTSPGLPSAVDSTYLENYFKSGYGEWADKYYKERLSYNSKYIGNFGFDVYIIKGATTTKVGFTTSTSYTIDLASYGGSYDAIMVKSAYSIFKSNASDGVKSYSTSYETPVTIDISLTPVTLNLNDTWSGATTSSISSISVNGNVLSEYTVKNITNDLLNLSSIKNSAGTSVAITDVSKTAGTYTATYSITFSATIDGVLKQYTKSASQTITVQ